MSKYSHAAALSAFSQRWWKHSVKARTSRDGDVLYASWNHHNVMAAAKIARQKWDIVARLGSQKLADFSLMTSSAWWTFYTPSRPGKLHGYSCWHRSIQQAARRHLLHEKVIAYLYLRFTFRKSFGFSDPA